MTAPPKRCAYGACTGKAEFRITFRSVHFPEQDSIADVCREHSLNWPRAAGTPLRREPLPRPAPAGAGRCEISPCGGLAEFIVSFTKEIGGLDFPGSAKVCTRHEAEWPSRNWGTKKGSARFRTNRPGRPPAQRPKGNT